MPMKIDTPMKNKGFSIIELMIAISIRFVVILGMERVFG